MYKLFFLDRNTRKIELLMLINNTWNHFTVYKQMESTSLKIVTWKLFAYTSYDSLKSSGLVLQKLFLFQTTTVFILQSNSPQSLIHFPTLLYHAPMLCIGSIWDTLHRCRYGLLCSSIHLKLVPLMMPWIWGKEKVIRSKIREIGRLFQYGDIPPC